MKREEKTALAQQRILATAMEEFAQKGYKGASLNTAWAQKDISKGIVYHHFRDKDELYLRCVEDCFTALTAYLQTQAVNDGEGSVRDHLQRCFDARLRFFAEYPQYLGIFLEASFRPPEKLLPQIAKLRQPFDAWNIAVLTQLLQSQPLRPELSVELVVENFRMYMDFFNLHFQAACGEARSHKELLCRHEEMCHQLLDVLLYGVISREDKDDVR